MGEIPRQATRTTSASRAEKNVVSLVIMALLPPQQQQHQECAANEDSPVIGQPGTGKVQQPKAPQAAQAELPQPLAAQAPQQQGRHQQRQNGALGIGHPKPAQNANGYAPVRIIVGVNRLAPPIGQSNDKKYDAKIQRQHAHNPVIQVPALAEKSDEKKVTKKTQEKYDAILNAMQPDKWYKAYEFESIAGVKESRIKVLLKDMTEQGLIESTGSTKGKMYKKINAN